MAIRSRPRMFWRISTLERESSITPIGLRSLRFLSRRKHDSLNGTVSFSLFKQPSGNSVVSVPIRSAFLLSPDRFHVRVQPFFWIFHEEFVFDRDRASAFGEGGVDRRLRAEPFSGRFSAHCIQSALALD